MLQQEMEDESVYLTMRNEIQKIILASLRDQQNGNDAIVVMADDATREILGLFGITEPTSLKRKGC